MGTNTQKSNTSLKCDLYRALWPIYYLGKACGLVPVRFSVNASGRCEARLNCIDLVYSLCVLMLLLTVEGWGLWRDLKDGWEHSTRLKSRTAVIATCSDILGVVSLTIVCIVGSPFRWKYLQLVINKINEVDKKIGVSSRIRARRFTIVLTACSLAYLWVNSILDIYTWDRKARADKTTSDKGPINYAPLYFMYTVIILTEIQYTVATYNVGGRFVRLNTTLVKLFNGNADEPEQDKELEVVSRTPHMLNRLTFGISRKFDDGKRFVDKIYELTIVHSLLCDAAALINYAFGVVILTVTVSCLLHLVITPYFLILQAGEKHEWTFLLAQTGWCVFHIARMLIIVQPSYSTVAEGRRTAIIVSQLLSGCFEVNARRELEIFSLQLLHRPLEFSVCGLFYLDRALITSIAGVVTTYLVILIQFQNADETKGDVDIIRNATQILKNVSLHKI